MSHSERMSSPFCCTMTSPRCTPTRTFGSHFSASSNADSTAAGLDPNSSMKASSGPCLVSFRLRLENTGVRRAGRPDRRPLEHLTTAGESEIKQLPRKSKPANVVYRHAVTTTYWIESNTWWSTRAAARSVRRGRRTFRSAGGARRRWSSRPQPRTDCLGSVPNTNARSLRHPTVASTTAFWCISLVPVRSSFVKAPPFTRIASNPNQAHMATLRNAAVIASALRSPCARFRPVS